MNILLLPGFMTDATLWDEVAPTFRELGSVKHVDLSPASSIAEMSRLVLADAPERFVLVGFSMGGYVAREVVRIAPDRIQGLVLIATSARGDTPEQTRSKLASVGAIDPRHFRGLGRRAIRSSLHPNLAGNAGMTERVRSMSERIGGEVFVRQATQARVGDLDDLERIDCPTLVIAADADDLRSLEEANELVEGIKGASFAIVEESGHMIPLEQPQRLLDIVVPWLKKVAST